MKNNDYEKCLTIFKVRLSAISKDEVTANVLLNLIPVF